MVEAPDIKPRLAKKTNEGVFAAVGYPLEFGQRLVGSASKGAVLG